MRNVRSHWLWAIPAGMALLAGGYYPSVAQHWALRQSLIDAVKGNDFALTELLLRQGADPNTRDAAGVGLASWAVAQDEQPIAQLLIASGARSDLDYCLRHAAERNEEETALLALKHGADANVRNRLGYTPLMLMSTETAVSALLARGADVNARAADGTTPLMCAMGDTAATKLLLKAGADPNACDAQGRAPLQVGLATLGSNLQPGPVQAVLAAGADPNARDEEGCTPLVLAARQHATRVIEILLREGAEPNARGPHSTTALMELAGTPNPQPHPYSPSEADDVAVRALLQHGADPNLRDARGETALLRAADNLTFESGAEVLRRLVRAGADVNVRAADRKTTLIRAASHGCSYAFEPLVRAGVNPNAQDSHGRTALMAAMRSGSYDRGFLLETLVKLGADPAVRDRSGKTASNYAQQRL